MGCIKLSILDEQYKSGIKVSSPQKELTFDFCDKTVRRYRLFGEVRGGAFGAAGVVKANNTDFPLEYGDTLILQGFITVNDSVLVEKQQVLLTKDTLITFMFSTIYPCRFDNPLTDLLWLKEIIDEFEEEAISMGYNPHARIYQCNYRDGICFLLEMCEECPLIFRNCEGTVLCDSSKVTEINTCSELNIDFENIELIWEKNATLCNCIMDTLKGEWKLFKSQGGIGGWTAYPTSTIILKILNQNEDGSINYEIFAEGILNQSVAIRDTSDYHFFVLDTLGYYYTFAVDTFFYKGSFQYSYYLQFDQKFFLSDIKILYLCWKLFYWYKPSGIFVGEVLESGVGRRSKGILTIFMPDVVDGYVNYYEKIK